MLTQRRRGLKPHRTSDTAGLVGEDIAKGILRHDNIKEAGLCQHTHGGIVNKHIVGRHLGIAQRHLLSNLAPQTRGSQHVGLVDHREMTATLHRHLERHLEDALNLRTSIDIGVVGFVVVLILLTEIHTTRQLADDHKVSTTQQSFFQR